jgi:hypothetical protein
MSNLVGTKSGYNKLHTRLSITCPIYLNYRKLVWAQFVWGKQRDKTKLNSVALVRNRTIPIERPPPAVNLCFLDLEPLLLLNKEISFIKFVNLPACSGGFRSRSKPVGKLSWYIFREFPQILQTNSGKIHIIWRRPCHSKHFLIRYTLLQFRGFDWPQS